MSPATEFVHVALVGAGATALMDAWLIAMQRLGMPGTRFAMIGRWVGHLARGRAVHRAIAQAPAVQHELALGWLAHYVTGMAFAAALVAVQGRGWLTQPLLLPALALGVATVLLPLLVMQPAMGAGVAGSRTGAPLRNVLRSLANHAVFGIGLYLSAVVIAWVAGG